MLDGVFVERKTELMIVLEDSGGPEECLFGVNSPNKDLMQANLLIWAEWLLALVMVLVEVERVKMVVVCRSAGTAIQMKFSSTDWIIQKCCTDCLQFVWRQLMVG